MKFLNALEEAHRHIKTLWCALVIAAAVNMVTLLGWMHSESKLQIDVPPEIPESGLTLTQGEVPKTTIYSFAFYWHIKTEQSITIRFCNTYHPIFFIGSRRCNRQYIIKTIYRI